MSILRDVRAYSFLELLISISVFSFIVLSIMSLNLQLNQQQTRSASFVSVDIFRRNLASITLNATSWQNTIQANSSAGLQVGNTTLHFSGAMDCLVNATACSAGNKAFALVDSAGRVVYDATNPSAGISYDGIPCTATSCPLKFNLQWAPLCPPSGPCTVTQITVQGDLIVNTPNLGPLNPSRYSLSPAITRNAR